MKHWLFALFCVVGLSGCANDYIIATIDGRMLTSDGKPELDEDTGLLQFKDGEGRKQQIPQAQVKQILER